MDKQPRWIIEGTLRVMADPISNQEEARDLPADEDRDKSRLQLLLDVFVFQFKLAADGLRDVLLSPLSMIAAIMGLIAGGDDPYRYFRDLLRFGRWYVQANTGLRSRLTACWVTARSW